MKRLLRRWKLLVTLFILLPLLLLGVLQWIASSLLSPEALVKRIEAKKNCRVEIESATVNLFRFPARLEIKGLKIVPRDEEANQGKPLRQRAKLPPGIGKTGIGIAEGYADLGVWSLLTGNLSSEELYLNVVNIHTEESPEGQNSLSALFQGPAVVDGKPVAASPSDAAAAAPDKPAVVPFRAKDLPLAIDCKSVRMDHVRIDRRQTGGKDRKQLRLEDFSLTLSEVRIDPDDLKEDNHAKFSYDGWVQLIDRNKIKMLDLKTRIEADFAPFDPVTGQFGTLPFSITLLKDSKLEGVTAVHKMNEKVQKWEKYGLKLPDLPSNGILLQDSTGMFELKDGKLAATSPISLHFDTYQIEIQRGSWVDAAQAQSEIKLRVIPSANICDEALANIGTFLAEKVGADSGPEATKKFLSVLERDGVLTPERRLSIALVVSGDMEKPEVKENIKMILAKAGLEVGLQSGLEAGAEAVLDIIQKRRDNKETEREREKEEEEKEKLRRQQEKEQRLKEKAERAARKAAAQENSDTATPPATPTPVPPPPP